MLQIKFGDLFSYISPGDMIVHGCNCQGKLCSGFAAQIRKRFPIAYLEYSQLYKEYGLTLGEYIVVYSNGYCIFNAFTQEYYGRDPNTVYLWYIRI